MDPSQTRYTEDHEWVSVEGDSLTLGITDFAQDELGEVVYVDLPEVGEHFDAGDEIGSIESVKAVAEVFTPISGEVIETNAALEEAPETVNEDPLARGWLVKLRIAPDDPKLSALMDAEAYAAFTATQDAEN